MDRKQLIKAIGQLNLSVLYYKDSVLDIINNELNIMSVEIAMATPGKRIFTPKKIGGGFDVTGQASDFPKWFYTCGFKKRRQVYTAFNGNSKHTKSIVKAAIDRNVEGHCDFHEPVEPNEMFLYHIGQLY